MPRTAVKARTGDGFGPRLAQARKARGWSQEKLGAAVGVSQRVIAYYEADHAQPPGPMLPELARALSVSTDQLLGLEPPPLSAPTPRQARLLARLKDAAALPPPDQRAVITYTAPLEVRSTGKTSFQSLLRRRSRWMFQTRFSVGQRSAAVRWCSAFCAVRAQRRRPRVGTG